LHCTAARLGKPEIIEIRDCEVGWSWEQMSQAVFGVNDLPPDSNDQARGQSAPYYYAHLLPQNGSHSALERLPSARDAQASPTLYQWRK